jgi:hypothetical protein
MSSSSARTAPARTSGEARSHDWAKAWQRKCGRHWLFAPALSAKCWGCLPKVGPRGPDVIGVQARHGPAVVD